jgi:hypothetical protein
MADGDHPDQHRRAQNQVTPNKDSGAAFAAPCVAQKITDEAPDQKRRDQACFGPSGAARGALRRRQGAGLELAIEEPLGIDRAG